MKARNRPYRVSFSGIDGAGKTTQIDALRVWLRRAGMRVHVICFWEDIATLRRLRESASHRLFKSEKGIGTPDKPVHRRDKNVSGWYMTVARFCLYLLDTLHLSFALATRSRSNVDVIIFDRYEYDELANLDLQNSTTRAYAAALLKLIPPPDVAFLLDVDPVQARARKPEYPLDFLVTNRRSYLELVRLARNVVVVPDLPTADATRFVQREVADRKFTNRSN